MSMSHLKAPPLWTMLACRKPQSSSVTHLYKGDAWLAIQPHYFSESWSLHLVAKAFIFTPALHQVSFCPHLRALLPPSCSALISMLCPHLCTLPQSFFLVTLSYAALVTLFHLLGSINVRLHPVRTCTSTGRGDGCKAPTHWHGKYYPSHLLCPPGPLEYRHWTLVCLKHWVRISMHLSMLFPLPGEPSFHTYRTWNQTQECSS